MYSAIYGWAIWLKAAMSNSVVFVKGKNEIHAGEYLKVSGGAVAAICVIDRMEFCRPLQRRKIYC